MKMSMQITTCLSHRHVLPWRGSILSPSITKPNWNPRYFGAAAVEAASSSGLDGGCHKDDISKRTGPWSGRDTESLMVPVPTTQLWPRVTQQYHVRSREAEPKNTEALGEVMPDVCPRTSPPCNRRSYQHGDRTNYCETNTSTCKRWKERLH